MLNGTRNWAATFVEVLPDLKRFYLRRLAGLSREAVDDLVQETFSRALATRTYIDELDLRTYVFGIAGNIFLDLMRRQYRSGAFVEGLIHETSAAMPYVENDDTWVARWILSKPRDQQEVLVRRNLSIFLRQLSGEFRLYYSLC